MERAFYQFGLPVAPVCGAVHAELYLLLQRLADGNESAEFCSDVWMALVYSLLTCLPCYALPSYRAWMRRDRGRCAQSPSASDQQFIGAVEEDDKDALDDGDEEKDVLLSC